MNKLESRLLVTGVQLVALFVIGTHLHMDNTGIKALKRFVCDEMLSIFQDEMVGQVFVLFLSVEVYSINFEIISCNLSYDLFLTGFGVFDVKVSSTLFNPIKQVLFFTFLDFVIIHSLHVFNEVLFSVFPFLASS